MAFIRKLLYMDFIGYQSFITELKQIHCNKCTKKYFSHINVTNLISNLQPSFSMYIKVGYTHHPTQDKLLQEQNIKYGHAFASAYVCTMCEYTGHSAVSYNAIYASIHSE